MFALEFVGGAVWPTPASDSILSPSPLNNADYAGRAGTHPKKMRATWVRAYQKSDWLAVKGDRMWHPLMIGVRLQPMHREMHGPMIFSNIGEMTAGYCV